MQTVNDIYQFVNFEMNKSASGNTLSPSEFNTCLAWSNLEYFKQRYGLPEQYAAGRPVPQIAMDITQKIMDDMKTLKTVLGGKNRPAMAIDINGWADYPSDYVHVLSVGYNNNIVEILREDFKYGRLSNSITFPSQENPFCVLQDTYIEFFPKELKFVEFTYVRLPQTPVWGYTIVSDQPQYDSATSVQSEFPQDCLVDIAQLIIHYASANLRDPLMLQVSEQRKDKGV